jgi:DNA-binding transcriptional MerR regulator
MANLLPSIPAKRYFTIGEVSDLCRVKPYVLRYWEQEFTQLRPMKRRGNRRYYQHHEVLLIRRIRELLYDQGFTISGARNKLTDVAAAVSAGAGATLPSAAAASVVRDAAAFPSGDAAMASDSGPAEAPDPLSAPPIAGHALRAELISIRELLSA